MIRRLMARQRIRSKLIVMATAVAVAALFLACIVFWAYESMVYLQTLKQESQTIAQMLADSIAAAVTFHDKTAAHDTAATLRAEPRVVEACFFSLDGGVLAAYSRSGGQETCPAANRAKTTHFTSHRLLITQPIVFNEDIIGSLFLEVDLADMYRMWLRYGMISAVVLCLATLFAIVLSSRLEHSISDPILHLAKVAGEVSGGGSYSLRAVKRWEDETGQLIDQFNGMMETVNERDKQLKCAQDELELRVEERTQSLLREIAERKAVEQSLVNAKLAAETANAAKSSFLANMSHELRTPLNAILGYSEMLEEDARASGNDSAAKDLNRILFAGRHLLELINDVLDISKIEAGSLRLNLESICSDEITREVSATVEPLARKNGNRFEMKMNASGFVSVDAIKFRQSLFNLLSNACKFTKNGKITLTVERDSRDNRGFICWSVQDTGIGIAREDIRVLFQPFTQVDASATRRHGGTGLGLAISQRLCKMMGGNITVTSTPGAGSTFAMWLPEDSTIDRHE